MAGRGAPAGEPVRGEGLRAAIVAAQWHDEVMDGLIGGARRALADSGVTDAVVLRVPGSFELPVAALHAAKAGYDAVVALYHDQGLIPVKLLAFDQAVNVTIGLPIIRTSPDHGTAFDIAGTGKASPASLIAALKLAARMAASSVPPI